MMYKNYLTNDEQNIGQCYKSCKRLSRQLLKIIIMVVIIMKKKNVLQFHFEAFRSSNLETLRRYLILILVLRDFVVNLL